jgi:hypothetical protein
VALVVGEPLPVASGLSDDELEAVRVDLESRLRVLEARALQLLAR